MVDGKRRFAQLPRRASWTSMRDHVFGLSGADLTAFLRVGVTDAWIEFSYRGHVFDISDRLGDYWFIVDDPACPDALLREILQHFEQMVS
jgi:hypothetical protein